MARSTVREIRKRAGETAGGRSLSAAPPCLRCWHPARAIRFTDADYAELLGFYLGDGHIVRMGRTFRLRIFLDSKYPGVVGEVKSLLDRCFPQNEVGLQAAHGGRMSVLSVYSRHLPCLFPQHGAGRKHDRDVRLENWQQDIVEASPWPLLRGLIHSDGCSFVNRTGRYEYLSFQFSNRSADIARIFEDACHQVGIHFRTNFNPARPIWDIRINRRDSVARLVEHVGVKR